MPEQLDPNEAITIQFHRPDGGVELEWRTTRRKWEETLRAAELAGEPVDEFVFTAIRLRNLQHRLHDEGRQIDPDVAAEFDGYERGAR